MGSGKLAPSLFRNGALKGSLVRRARPERGKLSLDCNLHVIGGFGTVHGVLFLQPGSFDSVVALYGTTISYRSSG